MTWCVRGRASAGLREAAGPGARTAGRTGERTAGAGRWRRWALALAPAVLLPASLHGAEWSERFIRGEVDGLEGATIGDVDHILRYLFRGGASPECLDAADVDDSGAVNITDAIYAFNHLFLGGVAPQAPFPGCGSDPSADSLECTGFFGACDGGGDLPPIPPGDELHLGFRTGPELEGLPGDLPCRTVYCTFWRTGDGPGAKGVSFGVVAEGARIIRATFEGTDAEALAPGPGFFSEPGPISTDLGGDGAVAGCLLSISEPTVFPPDETSTVLRLDLEPIGGATRFVSLRYLSGLRGEGQPVEIVVVEEGGGTYRPQLWDRGVWIRGEDHDLSLGFEGPERIGGAPGTVASGHYFPTLTHAGGGPNAQGWSYGVRAVGGEILAIDMEGTQAYELMVNGFERHCIAEGGGTVGATGAVVLTMELGTLTLPPNTTTTLSRVEVGALVGEASGSIRLEYAGGIQADCGGIPVDVAITIEGETVSPDSIEVLPVEVTPGDPSGDVRFELGFVGPAEVAGPLGGYGRAHVFATLRLEGEAPSAGGWSFGVTAIDPARIAAIDLVGTDAKRLEEGGFEKSELTSGAGNSGAVSAVVLSLATEVTLPADATSTVARLTVDALVRDPGESIALRYADGLRGSGQPVPNRVTRLGATHVPTTTEWWARTALGDLFSRGDTNADGAVDLSDPVATLGYLFLGQAEPPCLDAADSNDDGAVDLSDAMSTLGFLFLGRPPPPPPFGPDPRDACGVDPTEDDLGCDAYAPCEP